MQVKHHQGPDIISYPSNLPAYRKIASFPICTCPSGVSTVQ